MGKIILSFFCLCALSAQLHVSAQTVAPRQKSLFGDKLLFRIQNRSIFYQDIVSYKKHLETFNCLYPNSSLLNLSGLKMEELKDMSSWNLEELSAKKPILAKLGLNLLLQIFNNQQPLSVKTGFDQSLPLKKCGVAGFETWEQELKSLAQAELFLREHKEADRKQFLGRAQAELDYEMLVK